MSSRSPFKEGYTTGYRLQSSYNLHLSALPPQFKRVMHPKSHLFWSSPNPMTVLIAHQVSTLTGNIHCIGPCWADWGFAWVVLQFSISLCSVLTPSIAFYKCGKWTSFSHLHLSTWDELENSTCQRYCPYIVSLSSLLSLLYERIWKH
jgi:hypothetical protein